MGSTTGCCTVEQRGRSGVISGGTAAPARRHDHLAERTCCCQMALPQPPTGVSMTGIQNAPQPEGPACQGTCTYEQVLLQEARTSLIRLVGSASTNLGSSYLDPAGRHQCSCEVSERQYQHGHYINGRCPEGGGDTPCVEGGSQFAISAVPHCSPLSSQTRDMSEDWTMTPALSRIALAVASSASQAALRASQISARGTSHALALRLGLLQ